MGFKPGNKINLGRRHTEEWKKAHSERMRGENNSFYGKKHTDEIKKMISEIRKEKYTGVNHPMYGKPRPSEVTEKMLGSNNPSWLGDEIGYKSLHKWLRANLPIPDLCEKCNERPPKEIACITGVYDREFKNYRWWCIFCHRKYDCNKYKLSIS